MEMVDVCCGSVGSVNDRSNEFAEMSSPSISPSFGSGEDDLMSIESSSPASESNKTECDTNDLMTFDFNGTFTSTNVGISDISCNSVGNTPVMDQNVTTVTSSNTDSLPTSDLLNFETDFENKNLHLQTVDSKLELPCNNAGLVNSLPGINSMEPSEDVFDRELDEKRNESNFVVCDLDPFPVIIEPKTQKPGVSSPNDVEICSSSVVDQDIESVQAELVTTTIREVAISTPNKKGFHVTFPKDDQLVSGYLAPPIPWKEAWLCSTSDLVASYKSACDEFGIKPSNRLLGQLKNITKFDERNDILCLKGETVDGKFCETLEEIFRRVQFYTLNLDDTRLDEETSVTLFEMISHYESCLKLVVSGNNNLGNRGWQACARYIKQTSCLLHLESRGATIPDSALTVVLRGIRMSSLHTLQLQNSVHSGRHLMMLVGALRLNESIRELYLGDNQLMASDGIQIGNLIKNNKLIRLIDLRNNLLQDIGVNHIFEGISENTATGINTLILWNNQLSYQSMPALSKALTLTNSLETVNIGNNNITNEGVHKLKEGLLQNRSLLRLGLQATKLSCEGAVALAEFIAEHLQLQRLDLRENNIKTAGLMALSLSLKVSQTVVCLDLDQAPKKDSFIKDYVVQQKRLMSDIASYAARNIENIRQQQASKECEEKASSEFFENDIAPADPEGGEIKSSVSEEVKERILSSYFPTSFQLDRNLLPMLNLGSECRCQMLDSPSLMSLPPKSLVPDELAVPVVTPQAPDDSTSCTSTSEASVSLNNSSASNEDSLSSVPSKNEASNFDPSSQSIITSENIASEKTSNLSDVSKQEKKPEPENTIPTPPEIPLPLMAKKPPPKATFSKRKFTVSKAILPAILSIGQSNKTPNSTAVLFTARKESADEQSDTHMCIVGTTASVETKQGVDSQLELHPLKKNFSESAVPIESDVAENKTDVAKIGLDVAENKLDVARIGLDVAENKTDVARIGLDVAENKSDVVRIGSDVAENKTDVANIELDVAENKSDVVRIGSDVAEIKSDLIEIQSDVFQNKSDGIGIELDVIGNKSNVTEIKSDTFGNISNEIGIKTLIDPQITGYGDGIGLSSISPASNVVPSESGSSNLRSVEMDACGSENKKSSTISNMQSADAVARCYEQTENSLNFLPVEVPRASVPVVVTNSTQSQDPTGVYHNIDKSSQPEAPLFADTSKLDLNLAFDKRDIHDLSSVLCPDMTLIQNQGNSVSNVVTGSCNFMLESTVQFGGDNCQSMGEQPGNCVDSSNIPVVDPSLDQDDSYADTTSFKNVLMSSCPNLLEFEQDLLSNFDRSTRISDSSISDDDLKEFSDALSSGSDAVLSECQLEVIGFYCDAESDKLDEEIDFFAAPSQVGQDNVISVSAAVDKKAVYPTSNIVEMSGHVDVEGTTKVFDNSTEWTSQDSYEFSSLSKNNNGLTETRKSPCKDSEEELAINYTDTTRDFEEKIIEQPCLNDSTELACELDAANANAGSGTV